MKWLRYVKEVFAIFDTRKSHDLLSLINYGCHTIKFTSEIGKKEQRPFLDVLVRGNCTNNLEDDVRILILRNTYLTTHILVDNKDGHFKLCDSSNFNFLTQF